MNFIISCGPLGSSNFKLARGVVSHYLRRANCRAVAPSQLLKKSRKDQVPYFLSKNCLAGNSHKLPLAPSDGKSLSGRLENDNGRFPPRRLTQKFLKRWRHCWRYGAHFLSQARLQGRARLTRKKKFLNGRSSIGLKKGIPIIAQKFQLTNFSSCPGVGAPDWGAFRVVASATSKSQN